MSTGASNDAAGAAQPKRPKIIVTRSNGSSEGRSSEHNAGGQIRPRPPMRIMKSRPPIKVDSGRDEAEGAAERASGGKSAVKPHKMFNLGRQGAPAPERGSSVRISPELFARLEAKCKQFRMSVDEVSAYHLERALERPDDYWLELLHELMARAGAPVTPRAGELG